ncbi:MAG: HU family DNA-binding protein [Magnetococcus sp. DMHC-6]
MNKTELVDMVSEQIGLTKIQTAAAVDAVFSTIQTALANGDQVGIIGFGTFTVSARSARTGRNPQTGKPLEIAAGRLPKFRPGKGLKDAVADHNS